jgi:hypothetical protein
MLKGKSKNQLLSKQAQVIALDNTNTLTPNSIEWWANSCLNHGHICILKGRLSFSTADFIFTFPRKVFFCICFFFLLLHTF